MTASEIAAWWGAAIGSLVFLWDIYKWGKSGPQLEVSASPNMVTCGDLSATYGKGPFILVEVRNNGDRKTTITHCVGFCYSSRLRKMLRLRPEEEFIVPNPLPGKVPHVLEPGERWMGMLEQNEELIKMSKEGHLCLGIFHSGARKAVTCHVIIHQK